MPAISTQRRSRRCGGASRPRRSMSDGKRADEPANGALGGVPRSMPALTRALKLQEKAAKVGFDWDDVRGVLAKLREEIAEAEAEIAACERDKLKAEIGDLL